MFVREWRPEDSPQLVELSLKAWEPVFASFHAVLGPRIFARLYPDWRESQANAVRELCHNSDAIVLTATVEDVPIGFCGVLIAADGEPRTGEIDMIAVAPSHQRRGIATLLITASEERMRAAACSLAVISTGGDEGHRPARATYDAAGYTPLPLVRYYKAL